MGLIHFVIHAVVTHKSLFGTSELGVIAPDLHFFWMSYRFLRNLRAVNQRLCLIREFSSVKNMIDRLTLFQSIGLSEQKSKETIKNEALAKRLETIIEVVSMFL